MSEPSSAPLRALADPCAGSGASAQARLIALGLELAGLLEQFEETSFVEGAAFLRATGEALGDAALIVDAPLQRLAARYDLCEAEIDLLLLAAMADQHEGYAGVLQSLHPKSAPRMTVGLATQLLCPGVEQRLALRRLLVDGPAIAAGLIALGDEGPFYNRDLLLGPGLATLLTGAERWPAELPGPCVFEAPDAGEPGFAGWLAEPAVQRALTCLREQGEPPLITCVADDLRSARDRGRALAAAAGRAIAVLELEGEQAHVHQQAIANQLIARDRVGVLTIADLASASTPPRPLPSFVLGAPAMILCTTRERVQVESPVGRRRPVLSVDCSRLGPEDLRAAWSAAVPELAAHAPSLAARFPLEPGWIHEVGEDLQARARIDARAPGPAEILASVRARVGVSARPGVSTRRPTIGWDRLVLPDERLALLHEAEARVRQQARVLDDWGFLAQRPGARGVRMLFCGPPGTGKTLSAEVLANALDTDLMVVDLSRLVSKWIGETEKNLAEVFAAAERSRAVLFFDEADALFGKRTEVSDAHDRYANLETAYLLGRLEQYEGLAVLATNLRRNVDAAFTRRLEFVVEFERPGPEQRLALWRAHIPEGAPLAEDVELRALADFYPLVGGLIRNAAVAAAFLAAEADRPISQALLLRAIRREYEKTGAAFPGEPRRPRG